MSTDAQRRLVIVGFLAVPLALLFIFSIYPAMQLFYFSLTSWDGISPTKEFVGFENYGRLLGEDRDVILKPLVNFYYYFAGAIIQLCLATFFAVILSRKMPGATFFKIILFMPFVLNQVAVSIVFRDFLQIDGGLDDVLRFLGLEHLIREWIQDPTIVKWSLVFASIWRYLGFQLLITYGAIQAVPTDQYEAARLEGANDWQQFFYITLPAIAPILGLQLMLATIGSLEVFEVPFLITNGANGTKTLIMVTLEEALKFRRYGLASAMALIILMVVLLILLSQRLFLFWRSRA